MELFTKSCATCLFRSKDDGGRGTCPLHEFSRRQYEAQDAHDCPRFKLGDKKLKPSQLRRALDLVTEPLF